jgi:hypothetical protein
VRTLLIVVGIAGAGLGGAGIWWRRAVLHDRAIAEVEAVAGRMVLDKGTPTRILLTGRHITDGQLRSLMPHLHRFTQLRELDLVETDVTDAGIDQVAELAPLQALYVFETAISDDALRRLAASRSDMQVKREAPDPIASVLTASVVYRNAIVAIRQWNAATGEYLRTVARHDADLNTIALAAEGKTLAVGSYDGTISIWDLTRGERLGTLLGHGDWVFALGFDETGERLASAGRDSTLRLWNARTLEPLEIIVDQGWISKILFDGVGSRWITTSASGDIRWRSADNLAVESTHHVGLAEYGINSMAISAN